MKKVLYIIPGWQESCDDMPYQLLADAAREKGYEVISKNVEWDRPLSSQVFSVPDEVVVFGFSLGAILAWLVAQKQPCRHLILASMTPHYSFTDPEIKKALIDLAGSEFVEDIITHLALTHRAEKQTTLYGDREGEAADILVLHTEHELNKNYIKEIAGIL
jgi:dienelactone hydrolase